MARSLKEFLGIADNVPSGRGVGVPASSPRVGTPNRQIVGRPPLKTPRSGQQGDPSASMDVTASILMQGPFYTEEDIEEFEKYMENPPYDMEALRHYVREAIREYMFESKTDDEDENLLTGDDDDEDEEEADEASVAAGAGGYTLPLGMGNRKKGQPPSWKYYAKALGNATPVDDYY